MLHIIMIAVVSVTTFAADEYVGGKLPVVFAGPRHGF